MKKTNFPKSRITDRAFLYVSYMLPHFPGVTSKILRQLMQSSFMWKKYLVWRLGGTCQNAGLCLHVNQPVGEGIIKMHTL